MAPEDVLKRIGELAVENQRLCEQPEDCELSAIADGRHGERTLAVDVDGLGYLEIGHIIPAAGALPAESQVHLVANRIASHQFAQPFSVAKNRQGFQQDADGDTRLTSLQGNDRRAAHAHAGGQLLLLQVAPETREPNGLSEPTEAFPFIGAEDG